MFGASSELASVMEFGFKQVYRPKFFRSAPWFFQVNFCLSRQSIAGLSRSTTKCPEYVSCHFENLLYRSSVHSLPIRQLLWKATHKFLVIALKQTDRQTAVKQYLCPERIQIDSTVFRETARIFQSNYLCYYSDTFPSFQSLFASNKWLRYGQIPLRYPGCRPGLRPGFRQVHAGLRPARDFFGGQK